MRAAAAFLALLLGAGCLKAPDYRCAHDTDCTGDDGRCEIATGYCSFASDACTSGRRYGSLSGALADQCVGATENHGTNPDAPTAHDDASASTDASPPTTDAPVTQMDAPASTCPAGYAALPGVPTHLYRRLPTAAPWANQKSACYSEGISIHLAIPDDATEATALATLAGGDVWIGVSDGATEGTFLTILGATPSFLGWAPSEPDNNGNQDCVAILAASGLLETLGCTSNNLVAVCECER